MRLALPESLRGPAQAAATSPSVHFIVPPSEMDSRRRERLRRLLLERRTAAGWDAQQADAAMRDPSVGSVLLLLDHAADAALIHQADPGWRTAWQLLEARGSGVATEVWIGATPAPAPDLGWEFAWLEWPGAADLSPSVERLVGATAWLAAANGQRAFPLLVRFAGGPHPFSASLDRFAATLGARQPYLSLTLYSPLFYSARGLDAVALLRAVRQAWRQSAFRDWETPLLCVPRLEREEFASALVAAGGSWSGAMCAGVEAPLARVADVARLPATLAWLARQLGAR